MYTSKPLMDGAMHIGGGKPAAVFIERKGNKTILTPRPKSWKEYFATKRDVPDFPDPPPDPPPEEVESF